MNEHPIPSALRELRTDLSNRNVWIVLCAVSIIVGLSGPFETFSLLSPIPRLLYWTLIVICTYCIGSVLEHIAGRFAKNWPVALRLLVSASLTGVGVTAFLTVFNFVVFGLLPLKEIDLLAQFGIVTVISAVVVVGSYFAQDNASTPEPPPLLSRLPIEKRGKLVALSVTDHYVDVATTKGQDMLLIRLSDAMKEVGHTVGLQVHRSHWIATDQVVSARRERDRAVLKMSNGREIPVSRSFLPAVRAVGLLPENNRD